ncbi:toll/interleukin-1 receptor domain-containing protein [Streptomyces huasconensis]|uniref:Toll/interleukin-1 receptor domain-containing protein n=1 Tax=Streptomyces huasconensis TaxID=1854574 RepID=A0ABV3LV91_9ACTN
MSKIFLNYRTGDGDQLAATLAEALRHRFGAHEVFRDGTSIRAGSAFPQELLQAVRRSRVLLAVIGPHWAAAPQLRRADDWVRRELLEAERCGIPVVPILSGAAARPLRKEQLPEELAWLADTQGLPFTPYRSTIDLAHICDELAQLVPDLTDVTVAPPPAQGGVQSSITGGNQGTAVQGRDFSGDIAGTIYKGNNGPFHTGTGDQHFHHNSPRFTGDGGTFVAGTNNGGVNNGGVHNHYTGERSDGEERR